MSLQGVSWSLIALGHAIGIWSPLYVISSRSAPRFANDS